MLTLGTTGTTGTTGTPANRLGVDATNRTKATVLLSRPVAMSSVPLTGLTSLRPGGVGHLLLTDQLPSSADDRFIGQLTALTYAFNAS